MIREFSKPSSRALANAVKAASALGHASVGPEHLLLALCELDGCDANKILRRKAGKNINMRTLVEKKRGSGQPTKLNEGHFSAELSGIINFAGVCAERLGDGCIGTEQLLSALLRCENASISNMLSEAGIKEAELRRECREAPVPNKRETLELPARRPQPGRGSEKYTVDLTAIAREDGFDAVIGREQEIGRVIAILARRKKNSACLVGEPGVGKTAIAEGIAQRIVAGHVPDEMKNKRLVSLDIASMVAGTKYRGDFEERFKNTLADIAQAGDVIVFIDEMHTIMGAGAAEGAVDAANILKPILSRSEIRLIGATTEAEYAKYVEKDRAFERRLLPVHIGEPNVEETRAIIESQRPRLEHHHGITITAGAVEGAIRLSRRYIHDRFLPDKALDLLDEAAARRRLQGEIDEENTLIEEEHVAEIVSIWTGIPASRLSEDESENLLRLEERLRAGVVGQDEAIAAVAAALRRARTGLKDPGRPGGCFIFCGPTGVGKTEVCRALARELFGDERALLRFDMSEFMEQSSVSKLIGAPPGYVGHGEGGQLTDAVRRRPYSVVVFDEAEKASPQVFNLMLQMMEEGRLTDAQGRAVDFTNCIVILTSNTGARHIAEDMAPLGFAKGSGTHENIQMLVERELKEVFAPEFLNRVDETIVFRRLSDDHLCRIAGLLLERLAGRLDELGIKLTWDEEAQKALCKGDDFAQYGARPLRRAITKQMESPIADMILRRELKQGDGIFVTAREGELVLEPETKIQLADAVG